jgi:hypothetical protein
MGGVLSNSSKPLSKLVDTLKTAASYCVGAAEPYMPSNGTVFRQPNALKAKRIRRLCLAAQSG